MLDAWRALAALAVLGFHTINTLVPRGTSAVGDLLWLGWLGVFVFFPISGYCILAASHPAGGADVRRFLRRRWQRIFVPYWASILLALAVALVTAPLSRGSLDMWLEPGWRWLAIVTLTQGVAGMPGAINPVYWSLCYEVQFYLVVAASMLLPAAQRPRALLGFTLILSAVVALGITPPLVGQFPVLWLSFAVGAAVFGWFDPRYGRTWSLTVLLVALAAAVATASVPLAVSLGVAGLLILLRPFDQAYATSAIGAVLTPIGLMSYSLYLTHVPFAGRVVNASSRLFADPVSWWPLIAASAGAVALGIARLFYVLERQCQSSAHQQQSRETLQARTYRREGVHYVEAVEGAVR